MYLLHFKSLYDNLQSSLRLYMRPSTKRGSIGDVGLLGHLSNLSQSVEECRDMAFRKADEMVDAYCREKAKEFQRFAS